MRRCVSPDGARPGRVEDIVSTVRTYWVSETAGVLDVPGASTIECQRRIWWLADHFFGGQAGVARHVVEVAAVGPAIADRDFDAP